MDATQCIRITEELLGLSNGKAGQVFELRSQPVLPGFLTSEKNHL